ncbi:hypothetical protein RA307_29305 [Xanthobacteraceae bacterium Astr-EGSB]|uniref:hypothetical protein n=1 Tax=Astrobacterium formosum TaxID=3069710 RepID=UPI0027B52BD6|nr:hypothetical protein [Xanthobacteraceae bacterium Astr-EGSB]
MTEIDADWRAEARAMRTNARLWLRPDAHLWIRHDADRFMHPGWREKEARLHAIARGEAPKAALPAAPASPHSFSDGERRLLRAMLEDYRAIAADLKAMRQALEEIEAKAHHPNGYDPEQPRWPAGAPGSVGGQWSGEAGAGGAAADVDALYDVDLDDILRLVQVGSPVTDVDGLPYYKPGGHHEAPRAVFKDWELKPETRAILDRSTTGRLPGILVRRDIDGTPMGHYWNKAHREYNKAVKELAKNFLVRQAINPENMNPSHAIDLLREIRQSGDPRIRDFNAIMKLLQRLFRIHPGRASE